MVQLNAALTDVTGYAAGKEEITGGVKEPVLIEVPEPEPLYALTWNVFEPFITFKATEVAVPLSIHPRLLSWYSYPVGVDPLDGADQLNVLARPFPVVFCKFIGAFGTGAAVVKVLAADTVSPLLDVTVIVAV